MIENNSFLFPFCIDICLSYPDIQAARNIYYQALKSRPTKDPKCVVPKSPKSLVWQHFGDNLDGQHARCTLCKEKGKAEDKWLLYQSTVPHPLLYGEDRLCCSLRLQQVREGVLCGAEHLHPQEGQHGHRHPKDCVIVKCNLTLLREMGVKK